MPQQQNSQFFPGDFAEWLQPIVTNSELRQSFFCLLSLRPLIPHINKTANLPRLTQLKWLKPYYPFLCSKVVFLTP